MRTGWVYPQCYPQYDSHLWDSLVVILSLLSDNSKKTGKSFSCFLNLKIQMSSYDNELHSGIDDVITEEECQKLVADALK